MESLDSLLREAEIAHGHLCAGQVLGVRMALLGCRMLGIDDPRGRVNRTDRKRLVTFVEIDRCATDAIAVVTGCRLGKRALKFRDWGKMAASFLDLGRPADIASGLEAVGGGRAVRIAALESSKRRAQELYPHIEGKNAQQMRVVLDGVGFDSAARAGDAGLQVCADCLRGVRRRDQLRPRGGA
jgi:formylmethanofuran dehydrogenase subunit E